MRGVVAKLVLAKKAVRHCGSTLWLWDMGRQSRLLASRDVLAFGIAFVGHDIDRLHVQNR